MKIAVCMIRLTFDVVFNPSDLVGTLRNLTNMGSKEIIETMIEKINMPLNGGQLIQAAI